MAHVRMGLARGSPRIRQHGDPIDACLGSPKIEDRRRIAQRSDRHEVEQADDFQDAQADPRRCSEDEGAPEGSKGRTGAEELADRATVEPPDLAEIHHDEGGLQSHHVSEGAAQTVVGREIEVTPEGRRPRRLRYE